MLTVEFNAKMTNGVIPIPDQYQNQIDEGMDLKVIILVKSQVESSTDVTEHSVIKQNSDEMRKERLNKLFGAWQNDQNLAEIFAKIDEKRHQFLGRNIDNFDDEKLN